MRGYFSKRFLVRLRSNSNQNLFTHGERRAQQLRMPRQFRLAQIILESRQVLAAVVGNCPQPTNRISRESTIRVLLQIPLKQFLGPGTVSRRLLDIRLLSGIGPCPRKLAASVHEQSS